MTRDDFDDELFIAFLKLSRDGSGPIFDLQKVCEVAGLVCTPQQLIGFAESYDQIYGTMERSTLKEIIFEVWPEGFRRAKDIEKARTKPSLRDRLSSLPYGKGLWDVFKIGLGVILGVVATNYFG